MVAHSYFKLVYMVFVTLTLKFDLVLKNFNVGCHIVMVAAWRASLSSENLSFVA